MHASYFFLARYMTLLNGSMLTLQNQPTPPYGYRPIHDLPTPPPAIYSPVLTSSLTASPPSCREPPGPRNMSAPHRGLPPPPAMTLTPQQAPAPHPSVLPPSHQPPSHQPPPPVHHSQQSSMPPQSHPAPHPAPLHHHRDSWAATSAPPPPTSLPPPPHHWSTSDESMRFWLQARTEEERTRQEQERTRQEGLRLEQRKIESDMLNSSLNGGIPPPMIPLVFTGMASGGVLPQAALDWAQQYMASQSQYHQLPAPPPRPISPESHREAAAHSSAPYHPPNLPPPVQGGTYAAYATSPTRPRGSTVSGQMTRPAAGSNISSAGSNTPQSAGLQPSTSTLGPFPPHQSGAGHSSQQDSQLFFHHWQPPVTQPGQSSGASNRPSSPAGESHKKRKAGADPSHHSRTSSTQRPRSPPSFSQRDFGGAPTRKLHKRHKSDVSWYHGPRHGMGSSHDSAHRARTPAQDNSSTSSKDRELAEGSRRDSQPETYSRPRHEDEGQSRDRQREREREPTTGPGERAA